MSSLCKSAILVSATLVLLVAGASQKAHAQAEDRAAYERVMAAHFQVTESEVSLLAAEGAGPEQLPVLLLLARESGLAPPAVLAYRRGGQSWMAILRRLDVPMSRLRLELGSDQAGAELERAVRLMQETAESQWATLELSDAEVAALVHVRVFSRYFQVSPGRVIEARGRVGSWIEVPTELGRP